MKASTVAFLTETTCGAACWHAKEEICRCSCGGKNHGILLNEGSEQPIRQAKIDGTRYELLAVGPRTEMQEQIAALYRAIGKNASWHKSNLGEYEIKYASPLQCEKWQELKAFAGLGNRDFYLVSPSLLWAKVA